MKKNTSCNSGYYGNNHSSTNSSKKVTPDRVDAKSKSQLPSVDFVNYPIADVPIPLTLVDLKALVESDIHLPTPAKEIKFVRRNVSLKQCKAIPSAYNIYEANVFITGVVHKNIQYVEESCGYVRDFSVDIPFTVNQVVCLQNPVSEYFSDKGSSLERRYIDKKGMAADSSTFGAFSYEFYNEPIECKLISSYVNDIDLFKDYDAWGRFSRITEKMEVLLQFKLLQTKQVQYNPFPPSDGGDEEDNGEANRNLGNTNNGGFDIRRLPRAQRRPGQ